MLAAGRGVDNLFWFVDNNKKQLDGTIEQILPQGDLLAKAEAFGFDAQRVNGNCVVQISEAIHRAEAVSGKAHMIILDSIKGAGIPEVEETVFNHSMMVSREQADRWIAQLEAKRAELALQ